MHLNLNNQLRRLFQNEIEYVYNQRPRPQRSRQTAARLTGKRGRFPQLAKRQKMRTPKNTKNSQKQQKDKRGSRQNTNNNSTRRSTIKSNGINYASLNFIFNNWDRQKKSRRRN